MDNLFTDLAFGDGQSRFEFFSGGFLSWIGEGLYKGGRYGSPDDEQRKELRV